MWVRVPIILFAIETFILGPYLLSDTGQDHEDGKDNYSIEQHQRKGSKLVEVSRNSIKNISNRAYYRKYKNISSNNTLKPSSASGKLVHHCNDGKCVVYNSPTRGIYLYNRSTRPVRPERLMVQFEHSLFDTSKVELILKRNSGYRNSDDSILSYQKRQCCLSLYNSRLNFTNGNRTANNVTECFTKGSGSKRPPENYDKGFFGHKRKQLVYKNQTNSKEVLAIKPEQKIIKSGKTGSPGMINETFGHHGSVIRSSKQSGNIRQKESSDNDYFDPVIRAYWVSPPVQFIIEPKIVTQDHSNLGLVEKLHVIKENVLDKIQLIQLVPKLLLVGVFQLCIKILNGTVSVLKLLLYQVLANFGSMWRLSVWFLVVDWSERLCAHSKVIKTLKKLGWKSRVSLLSNKQIKKAIRLVKKKTSALTVTLTSAMETCIWVMPLCYGGAIFALFFVLESFHWVWDNVPCIIRPQFDDLLSACDLQECNCVHQADTHIYNSSLSQYSDICHEYDQCYFKESLNCADCAYVMKNIGSVNVSWRSQRSKGYRSHEEFLTQTVYCDSSQRRNRIRRQ